MKSWLTIWKQAFLEYRLLRYALLIWVVGETALTASLWRQGPSDLRSGVRLGAQTPAVFVITTGIVCWGLFLQNVDAQLSPGAVQLVPRLRPRVAGATIAVWLFVSAALAIHTSLYRVPLPWAGAIILAALAASASRAPWTRFFAVLLAILLMALMYRLPILPRALDDAPPWAGWLAVAVATAVGASWIVIQVGGRAEGRLRSYLRARKRGRQWREPSGESAWGLLLSQRRTQEWVFERTLRTTSTEARALLGLGPTFHWTYAAMGCVAQAAITCAIVYGGFQMMTLAALGGKQLTFNPMVTFGPLMAFLFAVQLRGAYSRELYARRKEQALLLILPGAPHGGNVNGWLMRKLLVRHLIALASAVAFVAATMLAFGLPFDSVLKMSTAPLAVAVLAAPTLLRNYASMRRPSYIAPILVAGVVLLPLHVVVALHPVIEPFVVIVTAFGVSAIVTAIRYMRLLDAPPAFPVGRLAS